MHPLSHKLWYHLPTEALTILNIGSYIQTLNEIMKNQGEKKTKTKSNAKTKQKTKHRYNLKTCVSQLIPYIADMTSLFMFSEINNKKKSRH